MLISPSVPKWLMHFSNFLPPFATPVLHVAECHPNRLKLNSRVLRVLLTGYAAAADTRIVGACRRLRAQVSRAGRGQAPRDAATLPRGTTRFLRTRPADPKQKHTCISMSTTQLVVPLVVPLAAVLAASALCCLPPLSGLAGVAERAMVSSSMASGVTGACRLDAEVGCQDGEPKGVQVCRSGAAEHSGHYCN